MRICFFGDGGSIHIVRWCKHFATLGHDVHLISFKKTSIENITTHHVDIGVVSVGGGNWKVLLKYRKVKAILKEIKPDILHALYATSYGITGSLCSFHPYIITALGTDVLVSPTESKIYKWLLKFAFSKADWITVMANHMKESVVRIGVPSNKISVIPFGIDPEIFNDVNRKLPNDTFVITSTRNFEPIYNIPHLIKSIAIAKDKIPNLHLNLIYYSATLFHEIENLINSLGLKNHVTFYGKLSQPEISKVLNQSHVFISVSLSDGNNISLNEAMACGVFCIATDIPANSQWIEDGKNGFLVTIDDVDRLAEKIITSHRDYDKLQQKAIPMNKKIIAERAIWDTNLKVVEQKYLSLISK